MRKSIYSRQNAILREQLRSLRKGAGFSQEELARRLRRPQSFVSKYETGERRLDFVELLHVLDLLDADIQTVLKALGRSG